MTAQTPCSFTDRPDLLSSGAVDHLGHLLFVNSQILQLAASVGIRIYFTISGAYEVTWDKDGSPIMRREKDNHLTRIFTGMAMSKIRYAMARLFGWKHHFYDEPDHPLHCYG